ncbi:MAG: HlyD family efflux transporter periplasmic adaptor subunit [Betaproteobacteria bacterium]|nr:HlyD family efflux transporter periplasmic adaptor subunit [Betaproteobacteria bacterium]
MTLRTQACGALSALMLLAACDAPPESAWSGYAEGDYVRIASPLAGALTELAVQAGQQVATGAALFTLESDAEQAALAEASDRLAASQAQARNTDSGRRSEEIAVIRAQLAQAKAQAALAHSELARQQQLVQQGFVSPARLEDAQAAAAQSAARVAELDAALRVAELPARRAEREAARATASAAAQALQQSRWRLGQKTQRAPVTALVSDTYYRVGEWVQAGAPVLALLPAGAVKARFFVNEQQLGALALGQPVTIQCDGCGPPLAARISRIATQAEYTPPVIYAQAQRDRLVFMVEARPVSADAARLKPGQPLDVRRAAP